MRDANRVELSGALSELGKLRYTPAGVPVIEFRLRHESQRPEAGAERTVSVELAAIAFEAQANLIAGAPLESLLRLQGFLCAKSRRSKKPVLHVTNIEFIEGD
ncbi:MAG TPA: primosomal replication protein N [Burkholderiales bacterium]|nr:primosomal replication protein N [Burkholderiales bacterium]